MVDSASYLEEFVNEDACFVDHRKIQRAPVLKEREIEKLVVDCEVIVGCIFIGGG